MQFRSVANINELIRNQLHRFPENIDLIVAIPRSGLLPASMLAFHLNLPLTDIDGFKAHRLIKGGSTRAQQKFEFSSLKHALVVDDSAFSGGTIKDIQQQLETSDFPRISYCTIYGSDEFSDPEILTLQTVSAPRAFEWNIMHHPFILKNACLDLDGILCFDPTPRQNDAGPLYNEFIRDARPRYKPRTAVHSIVTSRLEKYREGTVDWLKRAGINYQRLHMLDLPDEKTRMRLGNHAKFKASIYKKTGNYLFIESEQWQAREIARISGRPALCLDANPRMHYGSAMTPRGFFWHCKKSTFLRQVLAKA